MLYMLAFLADYRKAILVTMIIAIRLIIIIINYHHFTATWIMRRAQVKPTAAFVLVQHCPSLLNLQLTGFTRDSGEI